MGTSPALGANVGNFGDFVGCTVGLLVDGAFVFEVGLFVGCGVGLLVGAVVVMFDVGLLVGCSAGLLVGTSVVTFDVGLFVGVFVGKCDGPFVVGIRVGIVVGLFEGRPVVGFIVGEEVGLRVGLFVFGSILTSKMTRSSIEKCMVICSFHASYCISSLNATFNFAGRVSCIFSYIQSDGELALVSLIIDVAPSVVIV